MTNIERGSRKFWTCDDVTTWIHDNDPNAPSDLRQAAIWWCCYRETAMFIDDTVKHVAQSLLNGQPPYTFESVTDMVQQWANDEGDEGGRPGIDNAIEQDLRDFFIEGR